MGQDKPHMEKPLETAWVGLKFGWGQASGNHLGRANSGSQVDGVWDTACWLCSSVVGGTE